MDRKGTLEAEPAPERASCCYGYAMATTIAGLSPDILKPGKTMTTNKFQILQNASENLASDMYKLSAKTLYHAKISTSMKQYDVRKVALKKAIDRIKITQATNSQLYLAT
ncbi:hypothetical protein MITS9509_03173 [Synechococcus sp. MIT S9509]|nr:hypothetical protein [Synechococcus sp. MIT S9509]KZR84102.1 hypothetical protein MITS9504_03079 [Synechococcus sp. MIT S9504]KZR88847.1 hypothetical protein MITS9509_03173 [Synechococcus sp. MIT S9509]